jgi:hypothetical protein
MAVVPCSFLQDVAVSWALELGSLRYKVAEIWMGFVPGDRLGPFKPGILCQLRRVPKRHIRPVRHSLRTPVVYPQRALLPLLYCPGSCRDGV